MHITALGLMPLDLVLIILYGRQPLLQIDIEYGIFTPALSEAITYKYVQELKSRLENAFNKANQFCEKGSNQIKAKI